jgi:hypothetical protein
MVAKVEKRKQKSKRLRVFFKKNLSRARLFHIFIVPLPMLGLLDKTNE